MKVRVKLFATLRELFPELGIGEAMEVEVPEGASVGALISHLKLPPEEVKLVYVNGRLRDKDHVLSEGDEIGIFPPVGGG
jgi:molybdopterin synthase sulfur carrier subunit